MESHDAIDRWRWDHGEVLRYTYDVQPEDVVLDCGAYRGEWSRFFYNKKYCKIIAFEPVKAYYDVLVRVLDGTNAIIYNAGIGSTNTFCDISVAGDASSIMLDAGRKETIKIMSIDDVIRDHSLSRIRLMKINIEGAEYDLLNHMIDTAIVNRVEDIQIQFHSFVENAAIKREVIRARLSQTHHLTYDYEFVWENWRILPQT